MEQYSDKIKSVVELLLARGCKPLAFGRHKAVFVSGNLVYRVPKSFYAIQELIYEDEFVKHSVKGKFSWITRGNDKVYVLLPKSRLIHINGVPVQLMEKLVPIASEDTRDVAKKHKWLPNLCLANDGEQAGFNRKKKLRCYDFANLKLVLENRSKIIQKAEARFSVYLDEYHGKMEVNGTGSDYFRNLGLRDSYGCPWQESLNKLKEHLAFT